MLQTQIVPLTTRCYHHVMMELLTTPTKALCAPVNLPPPTRHLSPHYSAPPHRTSTVFYLTQNQERAGTAVFGQLSEAVN